MAFCSVCGTQIADGTTTCATHSAAAPAGGAQGATGGMTDNVAGLLAYVTFIPAIIFLVLEPYNKNRFIRFHAFQCLFLAAACFALGLVMMILGLIPFVGLLMIPISFLVWIGVVIVVILCMVKAYQNKIWKLPVIGDMAEKQANLV